MRPIIIVVALFFAAPAFAQQMLSQSEFRDAVVAMIRAEAPRAQIELRDELGITVRNTGNKELPEFQVNLDNAYREYQNDPAALTDILDRWVRFATQAPEHAQMAERVVAVVRPRAMAESMATASQDQRRESGLAPSSLVWRPLAGDLVEILVFDGAETIQYALEESLAEVGLTVDQAWSRAPLNLPERLGELEVGGVEGADRLVYVTGGNGLAPSTLLDGGVCSRGNFDRHLFLLVDRNGYIVADRTDPVAETQFRQLLDEQRLSGDAISLTPLGCHNGRIAEVALTD